MSTISVANIHFEPTGNNRLEHTASNAVAIYIQANLIFESNTSIVYTHKNTYVNATSIQVGANSILNTSSLAIGNSTVNSKFNSTSIQVGANVITNATGLYVGNSTVNAALLSSGLTINGSSPSSGGLLGMNVFTSNGTFTVPTGVTKIKAILVGGGGMSYNGGITNNGGNSVFNGVTAIGGNGASTSAGGAGGGASGGDINVTGFSPTTNNYPNINAVPGCFLRYGIGGVGNYTSQYPGGGGGVAIKFMTVTPGNTMSVTVGKKGVYDGYSSLEGTDGVVIIEY